MNNGYVFSWAENAEGKMVHVESVPRGLQCECVCPYCHENYLPDMVRKENMALLIIVRLVGLTLKYAIW